VKRRDFITLLGGTAAAWPLAARAQHPKLPIVGFIGSGTPASQGLSSSAFAQRLGELGWIEGRTFAIEYRWAEGRGSERYAEIVAEFVRLKVDVIFTTGTPAAIAAKRATSLIPIVFAGAANPVGGGLVASLGRPGGNLTGLSSQNAEVASKRLELLREAIPSLRRLAVLVNSGNSAVVQELDEIQAAALALGLTVAPLEIRQADDIPLGSRRSSTVRTRSMSLSMG
jgi:putative tryptophan/tyrosine transport system substrate-binding protein